MQSCCAFATSPCLMCAIRRVWMCPNACRTNGTVSRDSNGMLDPHNDFVGLAASMLRSAVLERLGDAAVTLQTYAWTRNHTGVGRHVCAVADGAGTHFRYDCGRLGLVYQVLHAVSLLAIDRPAWHNTTWYQDKYGGGGPSHGIGTSC